MPAVHKKATDQAPAYPRIPEIPAQNRPHASASKPSAASVQIHFAPGHRARVSRYAWRIWRTVRIANRIEIAQVPQVAIKFTIVQSRDMLETPAFVYSCHVIVR